MVFVSTTAEVFEGAEMDLVLKNTFVEFEKRDTRARRETCMGGLLCFRRESWNEEDVSVLSRGSKRAATCFPEIEVSVRRSSVASTASNWSTADRAADELRAAFAPYPCVTRVQSLAPAHLQPVSMFAGFSPCTSPNSTPPATPRTPWAVSVCGTPPATPRTTASGWSQATAAYAPMDGTWQRLDESKRRRTRRTKTVLPAEANEVTLLLRHLPLSYTPESLLAEIKAFLPFIDFYYLPTNFETKKNLGYGFVNFCDKRAAERFIEFWAQTGIAEQDDEPVQEARVQGWAANVERFRSSSVMAVLPAHLQPRVFKNGAQVRFPGPAKKLAPVGARFKPTGA